MAAAVKVDLVGGCQVWSSPMCLIENCVDGGFKVVDKTLNELRKIRQPVVVVSIVGPYRTGKSYLMNRLADQKKGFELGNSIRAKTKGIWVWCLQHPKRSGEQLLLLDTEGLGDVEKVAGEENDINLFLLTTLLSSCLVYNSRGAIEQSAIERLKFVSKLPKNFKIRDNSETAEDDDLFIGQYFPKFVWVVRDFTLSLNINGKELTADDYLDWALALKSGNSPEVLEHNLPRRCIRQYFPDRKCFLFPLPVGDSDQMVKLEELTATQLTQSFNQASQQFVDYVVMSAQPKNIGGIVMDGQKFAALVNNYTTAIVTDKIPSIETVVIKMAAEVNQAVLKDCIHRYSIAMSSLMLPSNDEQELMAHHMSCVSKVRNELKVRCVNLGRDEVELVKELTKGIDKEFDGIKKKNEEQSMKACNDLLATLMAAIKKDITSEKYCVKGGYSQYKKDVGEAYKKYLSIPGKGVAATKALKDCLMTLSSIAKIIIRFDSSLTIDAKKREEEKIKQELVKLEKQNSEKVKEASDRLIAEQQLRLQELERTMEEKLEEQLCMHKANMIRLVSLIAGERDRLRMERIAEYPEILDELLRVLSPRDGMRQSMDQRRASRVGSEWESLYFIYEMQK